MSDLIPSYKKILKTTPNKKDLSITLKKGKKGVGVFAKKPIQKGDTIAYYKISVYRYKDYESPTDWTYAINIYRKNEESYKRLIGDIDQNSFPSPENNIPYWGPFANEPCPKEKSNCEVDIDTKYNYANKNYTVVGDTARYKLVAIRNIKAGDEILWYYGNSYGRDYKVSKK